MWGYNVRMSICCGRWKTDSLRSVHLVGAYVLGCVYVCSGQILCRVRGYSWMAETGRLVIVVLVGSAATIRCIKHLTSVTQVNIRALTSL